MQGNMLLQQWIGFRKTLVRTHAAPRFELTIPKEFGDLHLPQQDYYIHLVDESERIYKLEYALKRYTVRRDSWREFYVAQSLVEGDTVVFDMIDVCMFKVHIIRSSRSVENEFQSNKQMDSVNRIEENARIGNTSTQTAANEYPVSCAVYNHQVAQEEMQTKMLPQGIGFCKKLVKTHVAPQFILKIPKEFADVHLPRQDYYIGLVDESEQIYELEYALKNYVIRRGWGEFSVAHNLLEGDTVVFDMIDMCMFKVHIIRSSRSTENELRSNKQMDSVNQIEENACIGNASTQTAKNEYPVSCVVGSHQATQEVTQANSLPQGIGFCKKLVKTHVAPCFKLRIPKEFSDVHLPRQDNNIVLVDESEKVYKVRYKANKYLFSHGWRHFVVTHGLLEGDTVVFDMIAVCMFKVRIIRSSRSLRNELQNNKPGDLVKLKGIIEEIACIGNTSTQKYPGSCAVDSHQVTQEIMQTNMLPQWIGFRKKLVETHVSPPFTLCIPKEFSDVHFPSQDNNIILVDECEQEYEVKYSVKAHGFTGGWRDFVVTHGLLQGDDVVFDMIDVCMFKVHIIRSSRSTENEIQNNKQMDFVKLEDLIDENACTGSIAMQTETQKYPVSSVVDSYQERKLCEIKRRVHGEVVPKGKKHVEVAFSPPYFHFRKIMHRSHVSSPSLHLPVEFCKAHLPCRNTSIFLVDKYQQEYVVKYCVKKRIILDGWRDFVRAHSLQEGDALVFQLIDPCKFKVYINSMDSSTRTSGAGTGQIHQVIGAGTEYSVPKTCVKPSMTVNHKKRSAETHLVGPKGKIRRQINRMVKLQCVNILRDIMKHSHGWIFNQPVDPVKLNIPDYFSVISEPIDLGTIKRKLDRDGYSSMEEFAADVRLTFSNAMWYNPPGHEVHKCAKILNGHFNKKWESLEVQLRGQGPTGASDEGEDSRQSGKSCQDNKKESKNSVHARAGKNDGTYFVIKKKVHEEVVPNEKMKQVYTKSPPRSPETDGAEYSYPSFYDCSNDEGHSKIVKKEPLAIDVHDTAMLVSDSDPTPVADEYDSVEYSESGLNFKDVKGFQYFKIRVNGETLDSEISPDIRMKYFQLCCSQKKYIHDSVMKGLNSKLVVAMISEIVSIADATKAASISTSPHDLECMSTALKSFQDLGMEVGSLRAKIGMLIKFSTEHRMIEGLLKLAETERGRTAFQEKSSIGSAFTHGVLIGHLEDRVHAMKEKREKLRFVFKNVVALTW